MFPYYSAFCVKVATYVSIRKSYWESSDLGGKVFSPHQFSLGHILLVTYVPSLGTMKFSVY